MLVNVNLQQDFNISVMVIRLLPVGTTRRGTVSKEEISQRITSQSEMRRSGFKRVI